MYGQKETTLTNAELGIRVVMAGVYLQWLFQK
jgi:hypothetical protein